MISFLLGELNKDCSSKLYSNFYFKTNLFSHMNDLSSFNNIIILLILFFINFIITFILNINNI